MSEKLPILIIYAVLGILIALSPILLSLIPQRSIQPNGRRNRILIAAATIASATLATLFAIWNSPTLVAACILLTFFATFRTSNTHVSVLLCAFDGFMISATLPWWLRIQDSAPMMPWRELALFLLITSAVSQSLVE